MNTFRLRMALVTAIVVVVAACGAAGGGSDPAGAVKAAFDAAAAGGVGKLDDFACAAEKGKLAQTFQNQAGAEQLTQAGVNFDDVVNAMTVKFDNITTKESNRTDNSATVHVLGNMTVTVDPEKFKPILKQVLAAQGLPTDDTTINAAIGAMASQLTQTRPFDENVQVVNEGGRWLICN